MESKKQMLAFEDLAMVDPAGTQTILREVPKEDLVLALSAVSDLVKDHFFRNMSERAADMVRGEIAALGPVNDNDVKMVHQKIVDIANNLETEGKIKFNG